MKTFRLLFPITSLFIILSLLWSPFLVMAQDSGPVGGRDSEQPQADSSGQSLSPVATEYGKIKLSMDAIGTLDSQGNIQVNKPADGTVRKAYLLSASTGFTGYSLAQGDVKINGNAISWEKSIPNSISSHNYWADVTNIVKPVIDAAPAGMVDLQISEQNSSKIDGEILAVIFDDPHQTTNNTVILYFGAQNISGDTFTINTGKPINTNDPNLRLDLSLGISYGCQGSCGLLPTQYSRVDVNGQRLTTSAGGQDDGVLANGALITVGGIGDSNANPSNPSALPVNARSDDELYNLKPFVRNNDTSIQINTLNPSTDDNILFAALMLTTTSTVKAIDIDISLEGNPTTTAERAPYQNIIRYFADAVFEASNGLNKLGTVTFHTNGDFADEAHIVWTAKGHPSSDPAGYDTPGKHINMYSIFQDGSGKGIDYDFMADDKHQEAAGYTLGHEFGHLYYSLYDEYKCSTDCDKVDTVLWQPHSTDKPVTNSIMNSQWKTFGFFGDNYNWLNFSIAKNTSGDTAQYRVYGASGWDTLARPVSEDPQISEWTARPTRLYHSELASVKPAPDKNSPINLPGTARSELFIIWQNGLIADLPLEESSPDTAIPYQAQLNSILGQNISYPDPIILEAFVHQDLSITDLNVTGSFTLPDGSMQTVQFADDGIQPDALAGDGRYSAILDYTMSGLYTVAVTLDNHALNGKLVAYGLQMSTDMNGDSVPYPAPIPVTDDFELSQSILISVSNVKTDDHGNIPSVATKVTADNVGIPGKIEYFGDADVFKITTASAGYTFIRVTNLAFGMTPYLRIFDSDQQTLLYEMEMPSTGEDNYLNVALTKVKPGTTVYAEITDQFGDSGGLYRFSVGTAIGSDTGNNIRIYIGNNHQGEQLVPTSGSVRQSYGGVNSGPVKIINEDNIPMIAAERLIYKVGEVNTSFSEMMALPDKQLDKVYWLPWYNNNGKDLDTQLRFGNVSGATATVQVFIGGDEMTACTSLPAMSYPYVLEAGESVRVSCAGVNAGPVEIRSDVNIVAAERLIYKVGGVNTSFSEMMALPQSQLDNTYWLPWYNNNGKDLDTQLRFANTTDQEATVHIFIGGEEVTPAEGITLQAHESTRISFPNTNAGPVEIRSDVNIVAAERLIYKVNNVATSFSEMMALPATQLDTLYWLPWYNNNGKDIDTQLRFGVP